MDYLGYKIYIINRMLNKQIRNDENIKKCDLTINELTILEYIYSSNEVILSQKKIMDEFSINRSTVCEALSSMAERGYIEKVISSEDSRIKDIKITPKGLKEYNRLVKVFDSINKNTFGFLSSDEQSQLDNILNKIISQNNIRKGDDK